MRRRWNGRKNGVTKKRRPCKSGFRNLRNYARGRGLRMTADKSGLKNCFQKGINSMINWIVRRNGCRGSLTLRERISQRLMNTGNWKRKRLTLRTESWKYQGRYRIERTICFRHFSINMASVPHSATGCRKCMERAVWSVMKKTGIW